MYPDYIACLKSQIQMYKNCIIDDQEEADKMRKEGVERLLHIPLESIQITKKELANLEQKIRTLELNDEFEIAEEFLDNLKKSIVMSVSTVPKEMMRHKKNESKDNKFCGWEGIELPKYLAQ